MSSGNRDYFIKMVLVVLSLLVIILVGYTFITLVGPNLNPNNYYGYGNNLNSLMVAALIFALKLLWLVFIISLAVGLVLLIKKYLLNEKRLSVVNTAKTEGSYACPCCGTMLSVDFRFCPRCKVSLNDICGRCGKELQVGWNSCPWCGEARKGK